MNKKLARIKNEIKNNPEFYITAGIVVTGLAINVFYGRKDAAALKHLRSSEWRLHESPQFRELLKNEETKLILHLHEGDKMGICINPEAH